MIRKSITRRISRRARRRNKVRRNRKPIRLPKAERTTVERHGRDGCPSQYRNGRPALSRCRQPTLARLFGCLASTHHSPRASHTLSGQLHFGFLECGEGRSEEHTSELQSLRHLVCRLLLAKKNN